MNTELQNKAWSVLPKEFKEEVKKYYAHYRYALNTHEAIINHIFGLPNLTSDADGETELLTVTRQKVMGLYANAKKIHNLYTSATCINANESQQIDICIDMMSVLDTLFGSKCQPDDTKDDTKEPKPAEPKFTKGDMVHCKSFGYEGDYKVLEYTGGPRNCYDCIDKYGAYYRFYDSDLEPYTEPQEKSRNLSQETANCDKHFDNILKDSFSKERRLNIATQIMSAILSNQRMLNNLAHGETTVDGVVKCIINTTMMYTDALIAECELTETDTEIIV